jgi:peptidoglycan L-alanyl-D-glutamate endopeptidase CwlK
MAKFGKRSTYNLLSCDPRLVKVFKAVVIEFDCSVLCGHRGEEEQNEAFDEWRSKLEYPKSKHNSMPSMAVDVVPYPVDWNDKERFYYFAGYAKGIAATMGVKLRWGGDWDSDTEVKDNGFQDLPHFEIIE